MPMTPSTESRLDRLVRAHQAERRAPAVAACVVRAGQPLWTTAVGLADISGADATPQTSFRIGSITKTFTAILVMRLRDAGELALDDPLSAHVPAIGDSRVTVRQALSHLSGLQREPPGDIWTSGRMPDIAGLEQSLPSAEWVLPAGRRFHYSNLAYALLGRVVEARTGSTWRDGLAEQVLAPLGLSDTHVDRPDAAAIGYFVHPWSDAAIAEAPVPAEAVGPAAQLWSTVGDLGRLTAFLAEPDPAVLAKETVEEMATLTVMAETQRWSLGFGLGLMLMRRGDRILVGHAGAMPGFLAAAFVSRPDGVGAAVLTNTGRGADPVDLVAQLVEAVLEEEPGVPEPWRPPTQLPTELSGVLGSWWHEGVELVIGWRGGMLEGRAVGSPDWREPTRWEPVERDRLRTVAGAEVGEWLLVRRDEAGVVTELSWATYRLTRTPEPMLPYEPPAR
jgi:CubicO group peptidase (beta-lactamase class C family)